MDYRKTLEALGELETNLFQTDFLLTWDKSQDELKQVLYSAEA